MSDFEANLRRAFPSPYGDHPPYSSIKCTFSDEEYKEMFQECLIRGRKEGWEGCHGSLRCLVSRVLREHERAKSNGC